MVSQQTTGGNAVIRESFYIDIGYLHSTNHRVFRSINRSTASIVTGIRATMV